MKLVATLVSFVLVLVGVYFNQKNSRVLVENSEIEKNETEAGDKVIPTEESKEESQVEGTTSVDIQQIVTVTPSATQVPQNLLSEYFYPGAKVVSQDSLHLDLVSSDDSDNITDWYKEVIRNEGMSVKTFVKTKTNGNVDNDLVGVNSSIKVSVKIMKKNDETTSHISVTVENR
jgi:hypothetical protein